MTSPPDDGFDALVESAYAEPTTVVGPIGDEELTEVAPTPPRPGVDRGVAGSLVQARERLRRDRGELRGPLWRDPRSVLPAAAVVVSGILLGALLADSTPTPLTGLAAALLIAVAAGSLWWLAVRHGPSAGERSLRRVITAERQTGRELADALAGSPWVLLHDRRLPHSEHRVPFLAVGPAGVAVIAVLPAGPYQILAPTGVLAGDDELTSGWLPTRLWEARYLLRHLSTARARDLQFTGPVLPMATEGYPRAPKVPGGWSAEPPYRIDQYPIRRPGTLGGYLQYLPAVLAPHQVTQLVQLVDRHCEPAPWPDGGPPEESHRVGSS